MKPRYHRLAVLTLAGSLLCLGTTPLLHSESPKPTVLSELPEEKGPVVQIALLLDTSGSMSGLIDQAKTQLWKVVNEFIGAEQGGKTPVVQIALYEYGNDGLNSENHWIREIQPLTRDLDKVSEELFSLRTNGGQEYCGAVVARALTELDWDNNPNTFKTIFIAGNEAFTQGPVDAAQACRDAVARGITVNTIHCGNEAKGISGKWKMGAMLADGNFTVIDHNSKVAHVDAPQDKEIAELNKKLNRTYIAYGKDGAVALETQSVNDAEAEKALGNAAPQRAVTKASANYSNARWDVLDFCKADTRKISEIPEADLPEELRKLSVEERISYVDAMKKERAAVQQEILALNEERKKFVAEKRREQTEGDAAQTLDQAIIDSVRTQAARKGVKFSQ